MNRLEKVLSAYAELDRSVISLKTAMSQGENVSSSVNDVHAAFGALEELDENVQDLRATIHQLLASRATVGVV